MQLDRPHRIMTPKEYERAGYKSPHIVHWNYDGFGNVAYWPLSEINAASDNEQTTASKESK